MAFPKFSHRDPVLEGCSTCIQAKQTKNAATGTTLKATVPFQGFSMDFSFAGIRSKNVKRRRDYLGVHGETCWLLITDHFSKYIWGKTFKSRLFRFNSFVIGLPPTVLLEITLDM